MYDHIQISKINDFIFCPHSIYFHEICESFSEKVYHDEPQTAGRLCHEKIEKKEYSTRKNILQDLEVASLDWGIIGKIDIFDVDKRELIERKFHMKKVFQGNKFQLYCQMICLQEMGFVVEKLTIRSLKDNKKIDVSLPDEKEKNYLWWTLERMRNFKVDGLQKQKNPKKCARCIYAQLCV